jgi:hypothetical protein
MVINNVLLTKPKEAPEFTIKAEYVIFLLIQAAVIFTNSSSRRQIADCYNVSGHLTRKVILLLQTKRVSVHCRSGYL